MSNVLKKVGVVVLTVVSAIGVAFGGRKAGWWLQDVELGLGLGRGTTTEQDDGE